MCTLISVVKRILQNKDQTQNPTNNGSDNKQAVEA